MNINLTLRICLVAVFERNMHFEFKRNFNELKRDERDRSADQEN